MQAHLNTLPVIAIPERKIRCNSEPGLGLSGGREKSLKIVVILLSFCCSARLALNLFLGWEHCIITVL